MLTRAQGRADDGGQHVDHGQVSTERDAVDIGVDDAVCGIDQAHVDAAHEQGQFPLRRVQKARIAGARRHGRGDGGTAPVGARPGHQPVGFGDGANLFTEAHVIADGLGDVAHADLVAAVAHGHGGMARLGASSNTKSMRARPWP